MDMSVKDNKDKGNVRFASGTIDVKKGKNTDENGKMDDDEFNHDDNENEISSMVDELIRHYSKIDDDQAEENETELDLFDIESSLAADDEFRSDLTGDLGFKIVSSCNNEAAYQSALSLFIQSFFIEIFAFRRQRITYRICNLIHRRFGKDSSVDFANTTNLISRTGRDFVYSSESPEERMDICISFVNVAKEGHECCIEALLIARHVGILARDKYQDAGSLQRDGAEYLGKHLFGGSPGSITRRDVYLAKGILCNFSSHLFKEIVTQSSKALEIERIEVVVALIEVLSNNGMGKMLQSFLGGEAGVDWVSVAMGCCDNDDNDDNEDLFKEFFVGLMKAIPCKATMVILQKWEREIDKKAASSPKKLFELISEVGYELCKDDDYLQQVSLSKGNKLIDVFSDKLMETQKNLDEEERKRLCFDDVLSPWLAVQKNVALHVQNNDDTIKTMHDVSHDEGSNEANNMERPRRSVEFSKSTIERKSVDKGDIESPVVDAIEDDISISQKLLSASTNDDEVKISIDSSRHEKLRYICIPLLIIAIIAAIIAGVVMTLKIEDDEPDEPIKESGFRPADSSTSTPTEIENVILTISPAATTNSITFNPRGMALRWITNDDKRNLNATSPTLIQRYAMALLYYSTFGEYWTQNQNWLSEENECDWYGITCDIAGNIWDVSLGGNNMTGALPYEIITSVPHLRNLFLHNNSITGSLPSIPEGIIVESSLRSLSLEFNKLTGSVPSNWMRYLNTSYLYLRSNQLDGTFPEISYENFHIQLLDLSSNNIGGTLPTNITNLVNLVELHLHDNSFSGELPSSVTNLSRLDELSLYYNEFNGTIPCAKLTLRTPHIKISSDCLAKNVTNGNITISQDVICPCCVICCSTDESRCQSIGVHNASKRMKIGHDVERKRWRNHD